MESGDLLSTLTLTLLPLQSLKYRFPVSQSVIEDRNILYKIPLASQLEECRKFVLPNSLSYILNLSVYVSNNIKATFVGKGAFPKSNFT